MLQEFIILVGGVYSLRASNIAFRPLTAYPTLVQIFRPGFQRSTEYDLISIPFEGLFYLFLSYDITSLWTIMVFSQYY